MVLRKKKPAEGTVVTDINAVCVCNAPSAELHIRYLLTRALDLQARRAGAQIGAVKKGARQAFSVGRLPLYRLSLALGRGISDPLRANCCGRLNQAASYDRRSACLMKVGIA